MQGEDGSLTEKLEQSGLALEIRTVRSGREAIGYLRGAEEGSEAGRGIPGAVIVDLTFGCITGWEVLAWMNKRVELRPVAIIAKVSEGDTDGIERAKWLGAHRCVSGGDELLSVLRALEAFWVTNASHPSAAAASRNVTENCKCS